MAATWILEIFGLEVGWPRAGNIGLYSLGRSQAPSGRITSGKPCQSHLLRNDTHSTSSID